MINKTFIFIFTMLFASKVAAEYHTYYDAVTFIARDPTYSPNKAIRLSNHSSPASLTSPISTSSAPAAISASAPMSVPTSTAVSTGKTAAISTNPAVKIPAPQAVLGGQNQIKPSSTPNGYLWLGGSLLFEVNEIEALNKAVKSYEEKNSQALAAKAGKHGRLAEDSNKPADCKEFFVEALLYYSPNDWIVWINNEKIVSGNHTPWFGLTLEKVENNLITAKWQPDTPLGNIINDLPTLLLNYSSQDDNIFSNKNSKIIYNKNENSLVFSLAPNQSLDLNGLTIKEGNNIIDAPAGKIIDSSNSLSQAVNLDNTNKGDHRNIDDEAYNLKKTRP